MHLESAKTIKLIFIIVYELKLFQSQSQSGFIIVCECIIGFRKQSSSRVVGVRIKSGKFIACYTTM